MKRSSGLLVVRRSGAEVEVLLARMGGPIWIERREQAWSIPKGEWDVGEDSLAAALREFSEETGIPAPPGPYVSLGTSVQWNNKLVEIFVARGDLDLSNFRSNLFSMEWPEGSGIVQEFPEMDAVAYFTLADAAARILPAQTVFLDRLDAAIKGPLLVV